MKKFLLVFLALIVLAALGAGAWYWNREKHLDEFAKLPYGSETRTVVIPPKSGPRALANLLAKNLVVSDADDYFNWIRRAKLAPKTKAGEYEFVLPMTPEQVTQKIISGQQKLYHFTVPEGLRQDEVLPILANSELHLNLDRLNELATDPDFIRKTGVPGAPKNLEGFLFPDTYSFTHGFTEESVLSKMVSRTLEEYKKADAERDPSIKLNLFQTITLASIVEKETGSKADRTHIACVYNNRVKQKMRMGADPTVLYAMMLIRGKFIKNITSADLKTPHPYNTYVVFGLPPGPIAQPGAAAIQATLKPLACNDLYFVSRNDGTSEFCPDAKCHEAAVDKWQKQYWHNKQVSSSSSSTTKTTTTSTKTKKRAHH